MAWFYLQSFSINLFVQRTQHKKMSSKIIAVLLIFFHIVSIGSGYDYDQVIKVFKFETDIDITRKDIGIVFTNNRSYKNYQMFSVKNLINNTFINNKCFQVNETSGMLSMSSYLSGRFELQIEMNQIKNGNWFKTNVTVQIYTITNSMIENSGSIQFSGTTAEQFIDRSEGKSLNDRFTRLIQDNINNYKLCDDFYSDIKVEIFAINQNSKNASLLDVRFIATTKNYKNEYIFQPYLVHFDLMKHKNDIENKLGVKITAINIYECLNEDYLCKPSCHNKLIKSNETKLIQAQSSCFLGPTAIANTVCELQDDLAIFNDHINENRNIVLDDNCPVFYPPVQPHIPFAISFNVIPSNLNGVLLYFGPFHNQMTSTENKDFLLLELISGLPTLVIKFQSEVLFIPSKCILTQSMINTVNIIINKNNIEINVRNNSSSCRTSTKYERNHKVLNIDTPFRIGGENNKDFKAAIKSLLNVKYTSQNKYLNGFIKHLQITNYKVDKINQESKKIKEAKTNLSSSNNIFYILFGIHSVAVIMLLLLLKKKQKFENTPKIIKYTKSQLIDKTGKLFCPYFIFLL